MTYKVKKKLAENWRIIVKANGDVTRWDVQIKLQRTINYGLIGTHKIAKTNATGRSLATKLDAAVERAMEDLGEGMKSQIREGVEEESRVAEIKSAVESNMGELPIDEYEEHADWDVPRAHSRV